MNERLKEYIEKDEIYQNYKKDKLMNASDFEKFCIQHCKDIEELLEENKDYKKRINNSIAYLNRNIKFCENMGYDHLIQDQLSVILKEINYD